MKRVIAAAFALALAGLVTVSAQNAQNPPNAMSKELTSLQGTWVLTSVNGSSVADSGSEISLTFTGDKYVQTVDGDVVERGTVKLDPSKKPMVMDLNILEGGDAGKLQLGVVQISEKLLTGKLNTPGSTDRPTDFAPADGFFVFNATKK